MRDLIIIGGSAAATAAGVYAARRKLDFFIVTKEFGGEVATSGEIGNWPGIIETNGIELARSFRQHLDHYGVDIREDLEAVAIRRENGKEGKPILLVRTRKCATMATSAEKVKELSGDGAEEHQAKAVIVATGVHPRKLKVPGEDDFYQKGVSYCTVCDGPLFSGKKVAVIGGGNSALESGLMLTSIAEEVTIVNRNPAMKGETSLIEKLQRSPNVKFIYNANTSKIIGQQMVSGLEYQDASGGETKSLAVEGIFVHIGMVPNTVFIGDFLELDDYKKIKVDKLMHTSVPGVFAAGDVTDIPHQQIVIAAGQGVMAVLEAVSYINQW